MCASRRPSQQLSRSHASNGRSSWLWTAVQRALIAKAPRCSEFGPRTQEQTTVVGRREVPMSQSLHNPGHHRPARRATTPMTDCCGSRSDGLLWLEPTRLFELPLPAARPGFPDSELTPRARKIERPSCASRCKCDGVGRSCFRSIPAG